MELWRGSAAKKEDTCKNQAGDLDTNYERKSSVEK